MLRSVSSTWARAALPVSAVAVLAVSCGGRTLNGESAASQILAQLQAAEGPQIVSVDCPDGVEVAEGATFTCTANEEGGTTWAIEVVQLDDEGTLDYRVAPEPST